MPNDLPLRPPEKQLKMLERWLSTMREGLLFVVTPDAEAERAVVEQVRLCLGPEVSITEIVLKADSPEQSRLSNLMESLPPPTGQAAVFLHGLDDLSPEDRETAVNAMNTGRETMRGRGYVVVFWTRPGTPAFIGTRSVDFYSWRSDVFEFDVPSDSAEREAYFSRLRLFSPSPLDDLRRRYLDFVAQSYRWLDFRGLLQVRNVLRMPLEDVFVPLHATTIEERRPDFGELDRERSEAVESVPPAVAGGYTRRPSPVRVERRVELYDALRRHRRFVVLGDPGSGKSTMLRFLAFAFAQGREKVQKLVGLDEDRLPILVPLSAFSESRKSDVKPSLLEFLSRHFTKQSLPDFSGLFAEALSAGNALVLLDGLDEMLTPGDRSEVMTEIIRFSNDFPTARIVVTSRIAGFLSGTFPPDFEIFTLAPFTDDDIKRFSEQWARAFEAVGAENPSKPTPDVLRRAEIRAKSLADAVLGQEGVKRLATNPLMLTLLALIHHQGTRLPQRRVELYRLCVEALAETWNLARSLTGRPIDLHLAGRRLDEQFVVRVLAPVAYWMHAEKPTGTVRRDELEAKIAEQFEQDGKTPAEARTLAHDFVELAREHMGLLVEHAPDEFRFLHLSIEEYLAARYLVRERGKAAERIHKLRHKSRWQEPILLAVAFESSYSPENADDLVQTAILAEGQEAKSKRFKPSRYEDVLHRDLIFAGRCFADCVEAETPCRRKTLETLTKVYLDPKQGGIYYPLSKRILEVFKYVRDLGNFAEIAPIPTLRNERGTVMLQTVCDFELLDAKVFVTVDGVHYTDEDEKKWKRAIKWPKRVTPEQFRTVVIKLASQLIELLKWKDSRVRRGAASMLKNSIDKLPQEQIENLAVKIRKSLKSKPELWDLLWALCQALDERRPDA